MNVVTKRNTLLTTTTNSIIGLLLARAARKLEKTYFHKTSEGGYQYGVLDSHGAVASVKEHFDGESNAIDLERQCCNSSDHCHMGSSTGAGGECTGSSSG